MEQNGWQTAFLSTPLPIYTITASTCTSHILTFCSVYKLLLDFLSRQSIPVSFAICISLVHIDGQMPSASLWNKHTIPYLCPKFFVISLSAPSCSSKSKFIFFTYILTFLPFLLLSNLATIFAVFATKLDFVPFVIFCNTITVTLGHCLFHLCCWSFSDRFLHLAFQNIRAIILCIYLLFRFDFWFFGPLVRSQSSVV